MQNVDMQHSAQGGGARNILIGGGLLLFVGVLGAFIYSQMGKPSAGPKRQTVQIAVLPDTPPPPPPPREEKKPEPRPEENKPQPQEQPKPLEAPPEPQQLKMDGPAGDGPSAFAAGNVTSEYKGGDIGSGTGGGGAAIADRLSALTYGNAAKRELNEFLNREAALRRAKDYRLPISLWLRPDGSIEKFELSGTSGNPELDELLQSTLRRFAGFRLAPPQGLTQPMRLQVTNRAAG